MDNELQSKLVEVLTGISEGVGQAKDFAVEQLPDVAQQYIMFSMVWETGAFIMSLVLSVALAVWVFRSVKISLDEEASFKAQDNASIITIFGGAFMFLACFVTVLKFKATMLVWLAPKMYLLQGIANLVK
jgi:hypothetical protein